MTKNYENSEIIQKGEIKHKHAHILSLSLPVTEFR